MTQLLSSTRGGALEVEKKKSRHQGPSANQNEPGDSVYSVGDSLYFAQMSSNSSQRLKQGPDLT